MTPEEAHPGAQRWHARLHRALMPDYNRSAALYWWLATVSGGLLLLWCSTQVIVRPAEAILQVAAGMALAVAAGLFPMRIPGTKVSFASGEVCIFLVLLLQGPAAAAVAAAGEAAMASYRTSKRWTSRLGSPAMAALAMFAAGSLFDAGRDALAGSGSDGPAPLLALAMAVGAVYFLLSATLMSGVARLRRGEHLWQLADAIGVFRWVGLAYAGSAAVSALLYIVYRQAGRDVLLVMLPLLALLLLVLHLYYRQQEASQALRAALAEAAAREAAAQAREEETAARHLRELQLSERRFHSAFTRAATGMALLDLYGRVIQPNQTLGRMLGRGVDDLVGMPFAHLLHADNVPAFASRLAMARSVDFEDFDQEVRVLRAGGQARRVHMHCTFFMGPARHGAGEAGKPCLIIELQDLEPAR